MSTNQSDAYRPAGMLERYHIVRQFLKLDSCVVAAGKYVSISHKQLTPEILYPAVAHALQVHAGLSTRILNEGGLHPQFARVAEVDITKAIRFLEKCENNLSAIIEEEFMDPIDASKDLPLWRITVTADNVIIFAWHHAIGDGQSGFAILRTILIGLNNPGDPISQSYNAFGIIKTPLDIKLTAPIERLTDLSVSLTTLISALAGILIPQGWIKRNIWTGNKVVNSTSEAVKTEVRVVSISPSSASQLLALSKANGATLTSTLYVLAVSVLSKLVADSDSGRKYNRISTSVPTSLRTLAKLPPSVMCEAVSTYQRNEPLLLTGFSWEKAAAYSEKLHKSVPKTRETIGSLKYLHGHYEEFFKGKLGKRRERSFEISNVGLFKADAEGQVLSADDAEWDIKTVYFAQDDGITGAALKISVVGSLADGVNACITWGAGSVDHTLAESFVKEFDLSITKLLENS